MHELGIKTTHHAAGERHMVDQAWTTRKIDDHTRQGFVERHIRMTVTAQTFFVAHGLGHCLTQGDAHIFDGVMAINVQVAFGIDF